MKIAATVHIQNRASIVARSHGPALGTPYWQIFMRMVPMLRLGQRLWSPDIRLPNSRDKLGFSQRYYILISIFILVLVYSQRPE